MFFLDYKNTNSDFYDYTSLESEYSIEYPDNEKLPSLVSVNLQIDSISKFMMFTEYKIPKEINTKLVSVNIPANITIEFQPYFNKTFKDKSNNISGINFNILNFYLKIRNTIPTVEYNYPDINIEKYVNIDILKINNFISSIIKITTEEVRFFSRGVKLVNKVLYPNTNIPYKGRVSYRGKYY